jgi:gentisate 1,2-dioxygenase
VRHLRFDEDIAFPIKEGDSIGSIAPLMWTTRDDVRIAIIYLPPGGGLYRHRESKSQLFCVLDGHGWVTGADGTRHDIKRGEAVLWTEEEHESGTDEGMTVLVVRGDISPDAIARD